MKLIIVLLKVLAVPTCIIRYVYILNCSVVATYVSLYIIYKCMIMYGVCSFTILRYIIACKYFMEILHILCDTLP